MGRGGISSVVSVYNENGFFDKWNISYLESFNGGSFLDKMYYFLRSLFVFLWLNVSCNITLVHIHTASRASFWRKSFFALISIFFHRKFVLHLHGGEFLKFYHEECGSLRQFFVRWVFMHSSAVIVLSNKWKQDISTIVSKHKLVLIYNPISTIPDTINQKHVQGNQLLFLGRLGRGKGFFDLLDAMVLIIAKYPKCVLFAGGDGDLNAAIEYCNRSGISHAVKILGWVSGEAKSELLSQSAIYVLPSYHEGFPMGVIEAMAYGLPIIATGVGGIPDAIEHGKEGLMVEPGDIPALAKTIETLLGDGDLRTSIGEAARQKVGNCFTFEQIIPSLDILYRRLGATPLA